jgi:copper(I)-binding protein
MNDRFLSLLTLFLLALFNDVNAADLTLSEAWVTAPLTPNASGAAAFAVISNKSKMQVAIVGASSDYAKKVQFHRIEHQEGIVKMKSVPSIKIAPNQQITLHEDGLHLMLTGLQNMPWDTADISIQLHLANGDRLTQRFEIRGLNHKAEAHHH